jgi:hypothetical protein
MPPSSDGCRGWLSLCGGPQRGRGSLPGIDRDEEARFPDLLSTQQTGNNVPLQQQQERDAGIGIGGGLDRYPQASSSAVAENGLCRQRVRSRIGSARLILLQTEGLVGDLAGFNIRSEGDRLVMTHQTCVLVARRRS